MNPVIPRWLNSGSGVWFPVYYLRNMGRGQSRGSLEYLLGGLLLAHYLFVVLRSLATGYPEQALWLSHVATLIGGVGILLGHRGMVSVALVCLLQGHLVWVSDIVGKWITGSRWAGVTYATAGPRPKGSAGEHDQRDHGGQPRGCRAAPPVVPVDEKQVATPGSRICRAEVRRGIGSVSQE